MPHRSFGAAAIASAREPITFDFGIYGEHRFTVVPEPSLGDTFDVMDTPDPDPSNVAQVVRSLTRFITRMLPPEDRPRFADALLRIPAERSDIIIDCATYIVEQVTTFPTVPPASSSAGRQRTGPRSKTPRATKRR